MLQKTFCVADGKLDDNSPSSILASPTALNEFSKLVQDLIVDRKFTDKQIKEQVSKFLSNKKSNVKEKNNPK